MHACDIAATLEISTVIVPRYAGVLSALGMLLADVTRHYSQTVLRPSDAIDSDAIEALFAPMMDRALEELRQEGFGGETLRLTRSLDVRYVGQSYEIAVPFTVAYREEFDRAHARMYGYANPRRATEIVNLRLVATGITNKPQLPRYPIGEPIRAEPEEVRRAQFGGRAVATRFFRWEHLQPGSIGLGPAVIAGGQATAVVPPRFRFRIDGSGNLVATRAETGGRLKRRDVAAAHV
jgi:N-methylhydantoinase A/oxoprolinase/acetone carboxylase beta subunit